MLPDSAEPGLRLFPALAVLPMGWTWSFWFVQRLHLEMVKRSGFPMRQVAVGGWPLPDVEAAPAEIAYCDNVTVVGCDRVAVEEQRDLILRTF